MALERVWPKDVYVRQVSTSKATTLNQTRHATVAHPPP